MNPDDKDAASAELLEGTSGSKPSGSSDVHAQAIQDFIALGAQVKPHRERAIDDSLERYRRVPLHAIFLYTSEDAEVGRYILKNWGALDSLSGEYCDIHPTVDQFRSVEDAYDFVEKLDVVRDAEFRELSKLPGIFFWDRQANSEYVSFGFNAGSSDVRRVIRTVFEEVRKDPTLKSVANAKERLTTPERSPVIMNSEHTTAPQYTPSGWERGVAVAIAVMIFLLIGWLAIRNQPFADPNLVVLLRIVLSVAAGILGATIPGFLHADWTGKGIAIRAGGALALFLITFSLSPAVVQPPQSGNSPPVDTITVRGVP